MNKYISMIVIVAILTSGCASMEKSIFLGAGVAGSIGTGLGFAADQENAGGALIGAAIGLVAGAALGYMVYEEKQEKQSFMKAISQSKVGKEEFPTLRAPEASCARVDATIEGNKYVGPHISCEIERPAVWGR